MNNDGKQIGISGTQFITADSPGVAAWKIPPGTKFVNGGDMTVDATGRVHVLMRGEDGSPAYFTDSKSALDQRRVAHDGWISVIGQQKEAVIVLDFWPGKPGSSDVEPESAH